MNKTKKITFGIGIVLAILAVLTASAAADSSAYFVPQHGNGSTGDFVAMTFYADIEEGQDLEVAQFAIKYDRDHANIVHVDLNEMSCGSAPTGPDQYCWGSGAVVNYAFTENGSIWGMVHAPKNSTWISFPPPGHWDWQPTMCFEGPVTIEIARYWVEADGTPGASPVDFGFEMFPEYCPLCQNTALFGAVGELPTTWENGTFTHDYVIDIDTDPTATNVTISNPSKDVDKEAVYDPETGIFSLALDIPTEVEVGDELQITACEDLGDYESNCNVSSHTVVTAPGTETVNLTLSHYCLDLTGFPMYEAEAVGDPAAYNKGCGPAVAKMWLDYMHNSTTLWNDTHCGDMSAKNQAELYDWGIGNNSNTSLPYFDTQGMWYTVQYLDPEPYSEYGYNFGKYSSTDQDYMVKQICKWLSYAPGKKPGHPVHVPGAVPAFGNYENWMAVRGIHTSEDAYPLPADLLVYGLWANDPYPASLGGIGENSYKTIAEWNTTYYLPLDVPGDTYDGKYVGILEPPGDNDGEITIVPSEARFTEAIIPALEENSIRIFGIRKTVRERLLMLEELNTIVQAAKDGANEQLAPHDSNFAEIFAGTEPGVPKFVSSDNGDYYLVPFGERPIVAMNTLVVVRVDAEDGSFLEASWVSEPEQYLPVSFVKAVRLSLNEMGIYRFRDMIRTIRSEQLTIELVYTGGSPYYPDWKITIGDNIFYVSQDEKVSA